MRKIISFLLSLCLLAALPIDAYAAFYEVGDENMSVEIDDTLWYVFTPSTIYNNPEADELGLSADDLYDFWTENEIFLDAIVFYDDSDASLELFVRIRQIDDTTNFSDYDDKQLLELAEEVAKKVDCSNFSVYSANYKFMKLEYFADGYYVMEYSTLVDGEDYLFTFQSIEPFSDWEYQQMDDIVGSVRFDREIPHYYIPQKKPETTTTTEIETEEPTETGTLTATTSPVDMIATIAPITIIICVVIILVVVHKKRKKSQELDNTEIIPNINPGEVPENYTIIKKFFNTDDLSTVKHYVKEEIVDAVNKYKLTRKTDLMQAVFSEMSRQFENRTSVDRDLLIAAYYQLLFDEIMLQNGDMNDFIFAYSVTKVSGEINPEIHNYLQMLIRIQLLIDETIKLSYQKRDHSTMIYAQTLKTRVFQELYGYIDDNSDWNKLMN